MVQYPDCPHCGNASTSMSIVDVEIGGVRLKGIQCNCCQKYVAFFKDYEEEIRELKDTTIELEGKISDLE